MYEGVLRGFCAMWSWYLMLQDPFGLCLVITYAACRSIYRKKCDIRAESAQLGNPTNPTRSLITGFGKAAHE